MSLQFGSVSLKNFGPYRDVTSLSLETTPESPVVLVHGENTLGKTRLFRALRWCLYGTLNPQGTVGEATRQLPDYLNRPAARDGDNTLEVAIDFTANDSKYRLVRRATIENGSASVSTDLRIDATVVPPAAIETEIGKLLHPQISEFFLFDGELLKDFYDRLNTDREREFIRDSIDTVLGIPALQLAENDVSELTADAVQRQARAIRDVRERDRINREMRTLKNRQESVTKDREEMQTALANARARLDVVKDEMSGIGELQADARELENLEAFIQGSQLEQERLRAEMKTLLSSGWRSLLAPNFSELLSKVQERNSAAQDRLEAIIKARGRVDVLREQIRGGVCQTCHQDLPPADEATHQQLTDAMADLEALGEVGEADGVNLDLERQIGSLIDESTVTRYREKQDELNKITRTQFERARRVGALKDRLKDNNAAAIRALVSEQESLDSAIDGYEQHLKRLAPQLSEIASEQASLARSLGRLPGPQPALAAESAFFQYAKTVLFRTIERYQDRTREAVEATSSEMFVNLVRDSQGYRGLRIGRDYKVDLIGTLGDSLDTSEGGKQLVALSLIGALKQAAVRGGPVVLDSPLARLDLVHRENVLTTWVPSLGNQVILLVQSGELTADEAHRILGSKIGREYQIFRPRNDPDEAEIERTI